MLHEEDSGDGLWSSMQRPTCQVAGVFKLASVYVVIKESDINPSNLIFNLCARHKYDLKYLLIENELEIAEAALCAQGNRVNILIRI